MTTVNIQKVNQSEAEFYALALSSEKVFFYTIIVVSAANTCATG